MWPTDPTQATEGLLETEQRLRYAIRIGLIHARMRLASPAVRLTDGVRPTFAVKEPGRPRELASIHR